MAARGLLEMVQLLTMTRFGPDAAFSVTEIYLIQEPLARIIEKYGSAADRFSALIDPIMVLVGVGLYSRRVVTLSQPVQQEPARKPVRSAPDYDNMPDDHTMPFAAEPDNQPKEYDPVTATNQEFFDMVRGVLNKDR